MAEMIEFPHIIVGKKGDVLSYSPVSKGRSKAGEPPPITSRPSHARHLVDSLSQAIRDRQDAIRAQQQWLPAEEVGLLLVVNARSKWGIDPSIPGGRSGAEILSIKGSRQKQRLNAFFPLRAKRSFENAADKYSAFDPDQSERRPNHYLFFESSEDIKAATLRNLWNSRSPFPDEAATFEWEVWLRPGTEARVRDLATQFEVQIFRDRIEFPDATVVAVQARPAALETLLWTTAAACELRPASHFTSRLFSQPSEVQFATARAFASQITSPPEDAPAVCVLDSGVNAAHPLLRPALESTDCLAVNPNWPKNDHHGHGTQMAGVALYGNLTPLLAGGAGIELSHRLESVTVLPPATATTGARLPASIIQRGVALAEDLSERARVFCLAMNAPQEASNGSPSSLSTKIDELASEIGNQRLFCVAAGNLDSVEIRRSDYIATNDLSPILSPGQAFNALTVGACTELTAINDPLFKAFASKGDLCPTARTSIAWPAKSLCHKPDIVMEGGNQAIEVARSRINVHADVALLTTSSTLQKPLDLTGETSAATAGAAGLAAQIMAHYPSLWPETVRGLIVHSARWTAAMMARASTKPGERQNLDLLRRFGFGKPSAKRALANARNVLTLIVQDSVHPLSIGSNGARLGDMKWHDLPWPVDALEAAGATQVELRVTLSYFPPPNPSQVSRQRPDLYPGYGLAFDVKRPTDDRDAAIARVNSLAPKSRLGRATTLDWQLGPRLRTRGSLQQDIWRGNAADLAQMGAVMVLPRKGWWSTNRNQDHWEELGRYALIVSIRSPSQDIPVYTDVPIVV